MVSFILHMQGKKALGGRSQARAWRWVRGAVCRACRWASISALQTPCAALCALLRLPRAACLRRYWTLLPSSCWCVRSSMRSWAALPLP